MKPQRITILKLNFHYAIFLLTITVLSCMIGPKESRAQDKAAEVDKLLSWATATTPGCSCAISQGGKVVYKRAVGSSDLEKGIAMTPTTTFDIGSTRKQFVAAAVLLLVADKKLSLSDDIHKYFPQLPAYGQKITVNHLLTHTSGIRDWTGIQPLASDDPDAMTLIMRQKGLNFAPGQEWSYSNSGYVLLAELVAKVSAVSFAEFSNKRIFSPLGMKSTNYVMDLRGEVKDRAMAYRKNQGGWAKDMLLDNDRGGAGALFSTAEDLLIWNNALTANKLGKFVSEKLQEPTVLNNGRKLNYGRGLVLEGNLIWHSGGAAGYHSWIGRVPEQELSVSVLCNSDQVAASSLADRILNIYAPGAGLQKGEDGPPPVLTGEALVDAKTFSGLFLSEQVSEPLTLTVDRDRFRVPGGPGLIQVSKNHFRRWGSTVFFMSQDEFELNFVSADELILKTMEGKEIRYKRASQFVPTADELQGYMGKFTSSEIGASFDVKTANGMLMATANGTKGEALAFKPIAKDIFQLRGVLLKFNRDNNGKIISLSYSNPVVKNINFFTAAK